MLNIIHGDVKTLNTLITSKYDSIALTWVGANLTQVIYSFQGNIVGTLTLTYDGAGNLINVAKT